MSNNYNNIPLELREGERWLCYKLVKRGDKWTKVPYTPTGRAASTTDAATWSTFEACVAASHWFDGIGRVFVKADGYVGIDLDYRDNADIQAAHDKILMRTNSYAEVSPSGNGKHIIIKGDLPGGGRKRDALGVEIYDDVRFFTFTGNQIGDRCAIEAAQDFVNELYNDLGVSNGTKNSSPEDREQTEGDDDICNRLRRGANAAIFDQLFTGPWQHARGIVKDQKDTSGSGFDLVLANLICAETGSFPQFCRLFMDSDLAKDPERADKYGNARRAEYHLKRLFNLGRDRMMPAAAVEQASADCARAMAKQGATTAQPRLNGVQTRLVSERNGILVDTATGEVLSSRPVPVKKDQADWVSLIMSRGGLVAEIAAYILRTSRRPQPRFAVAAAIATIATAAGRQFKTPTDCGINLYIVNMVETGKGKDAILKGINNIFSAAKLNWEMIHNASFKSEVSIYSYANQHPVLTAVIDEFGDIVRSVSSNNASQSELTILATLRLFYDGGELNAPAAISRANIRVSYPSLSLFTASTPEQFYTAVGNTEARNGFLNRFIAVRGDATAPRCEPAIYADQVPAPIVDGVLRIADKGGGGHRKEQGDTPEKMPFEHVAWTDEAKAAWTAYDIECEKAAETDKDRETLGPRCGQNAIRVATVIAIADNLMFPCVTAEHVAIAQAMIEDSYYAMAGGFNAHVTDSAASAVCDKILDRIEKAGGMIGHNDLFRALQRTFNTVKDFKNAIEVLVEARRIEIITVTPESGGRTATKYKILRK